MYCVPRQGVTSLIVRVFTRHKERLPLLQATEGAISLGLCLVAGDIVSLTDARKQVPDGVKGSVCRFQCRLLGGKGGDMAL